MRKIFLVWLLALVAGCSSKEEVAQVGLGVIPLNGATVTGNVVEASQPSGVLVRTASERSFLLPDDWEYRLKGGKSVKVSDLAPGTQVTAVAPARDARLVAADGNTLVMESNNDFFSFPVEGLASDAQRIPVMVQSEGGQTWDMPLGQAVTSYPSGVRSHPYYSDYAFPQADPYVVHKGMAVGLYDDTPLFLTPTSAGPGLVLLPNDSAYQGLVGHQPVRFTYADNNVAVSSWDSLGDGQFDISDLLLAGTLLDILPGRAVVQVDQRPITVPLEYLTYRSAPVGQQRYPIGTSVGVQYHPGLYDLVSYDYDIATFLYQQQAVQIPIASLPRDRDHRHRVKIRHPKGQQWVSMPFSAAQPLLASGNYWLAPSSTAIPYVQDWQQQAWTPRPVKGCPGYQLVGHKGQERVVRMEQPRPNYGDSWWARQPDWSYAVASLAGPAAWSYADYQRPLVRVAPYPRYEAYPNVARNALPGHKNGAWQGKNLGGRQTLAGKDKNYWNYGDNVSKHRDVARYNASGGRTAQPDWGRQRGGKDIGTWKGQPQGGPPQQVHRQRANNPGRQDPKGESRRVVSLPHQPRSQGVSHKPSGQQRSAGHRQAEVQPPRQARPQPAVDSGRRQQLPRSHGAAPKQGASQTRPTQNPGHPSWNGGRSNQGAPRAASQAPRHQRVSSGGGASRQNGGKRDR